MLLKKYSEVADIKQIDKAPIKYIPSLDSALCEKLHALIHRSKVMIFIKGTPARPQCGFTRQLIKLFRSTQIENYDYFDILSDESVRNALKLYSDWPTFPQIYIHGVLIGGLDIVSELIHSGEWNHIADTIK